MAKLTNQNIITTYSTNLTNSDTHVSFDKIISLQDKFTFKPNMVRNKRDSKFTHSFNVSFIVDLHMTSTAYMENQKYCIPALVSQAQLKIKGLFEATTILHDEVHASVYIIWCIYILALLQKKKILSLSLI